MRNTDKIYPAGKLPGCKSNSKFYFSEFCSNSSIHGLKFLGEPKRTLTERIWWLLIILLALYFCVTQILNTYNKWMNAPVIVTFATTETSISDIPFPAVTICPEIKSNKTAFNYTDLYYRKIMALNITDLEEIQYQYLSLICDSDPQFRNDSILFYNDTILDFITEIIPNFEKDVLIQIEWKGKELNVPLTPTLTNDGICYTFNLLDRTKIFKDSVIMYKDYFKNPDGPSNWSVQNGYEEDGMDAIPRKTNLAGIKGGLTIILAARSLDLDYICGDSVQGFKISITHPAEIPQVRERYIRLPLDTALVAAIKPNMMTTAHELKSYDPNSRKCYFSNEKQLEFFQIYDQQFCLIECLTNFTLRRCGCVAFYMPRKGNTQICGPGNEECIETSKEEIKQSTERKNFSQSCDCLPSCSSLKFDIETSQCNWDWKEFYKFLSQTNQFNEEFFGDKMHISRIEVYFKDMQFINTERNELYGATDFWANCGGLFGLFTGFSIISAFEILYYLTLRLYVNFRKFGKNYWSGNEEILQVKLQKET